MHILKNNNKELSKAKESLVLAMIPYTKDFKETTKEIKNKLDESSKLFAFRTHRNMANKNIFQDKTTLLVLPYDNFKYMKPAFFTERKDFEKKFKDKEVMNLDSKKNVLLTFFDGTTGTEEEFIDFFTSNTTAQVIGGSTSDNLKFADTPTYWEDKFIEGNIPWAFTILLEPKKNIKAIKTQSFKGTGECLTPTKIDGRVVLEFDGISAKEAYLKATGLNEEDISKGLNLYHPLALDLGDNKYIKSPALFLENGSIQFAADLIEDVPLEVQEAKDFISETRDILLEETSEFSNPKIMHFMCGFRTAQLEAENRKEEFEKEVLSIGNQFGFSTFGETYNTQVNQSSTIIIFE
jgi:hypothetical protein